MVSKGVVVKSKERGSGKNTQLANGPSFLRKGFHLLEEVKTEFRRISWTSQEELQLYTKVVVAGTLVFGLSVYCADLLIRTVLETINFLLSMLG
jgi:preprotein translocase subunit SecE